ncbi:pilus assembly protein TadB [Oceanobacillus piezotolerans]|uniref:Pilus assembly protein TadB n=1 Tax=Oceanobacillus piezotolerans TaxID=2448030 RepID=A0A498DCX3_9BACI|nr:type II secretion system F family protein [Oceanobacillus piezotolerans]RLL46510.1 pilus assembly protein TadB [Oceanobacillus piezotolerans]
MEQLFLITILSFIIFFGIALKAWYNYISERDKVHNHLKEVAHIPFEEERKKESFIKRFITKVLKYADDFSDIGERFNFYSESEDVYSWLIYANFPYELTVKRFQGLKIILMIAGFFAGVVLFLLGFPLRQFLLFLLPGLGYFGPIFWLRKKAKNRQDELSYTLPDFIDMVSVTLKAGASIDQAFYQISRYFEGPIREEFSRFHQRISLGAPRVEAYKELIERTNVPEFEMVIKSLIRGLQLGVPVAKTLEIQAEEIRKIRKEKVKEAASKASPKVTMITTFVVLPTAFIFIGGLLILNIIRNIQDSGGFL